MINNDIKHIVKYYKYLKPYLLHFGIAIFLMSLLSFFSLVFPFFNKIIIDDVIINRDTSLLFWVFIGMIVVKLITGVLSVFRNYVLSYIGNKINLSLKFAFINHIIHLPFTFFNEKKIGEIQSRIGDSGVIQTIISSLVLDLGTDIISLLVFITVLYIMNVPLALAVTLLIPVYIINSKLFSGYYRKNSQNLWEKSTKINSLSYELLAGIRTVKTFALEKRFLRRLKYFTMDALKLDIEINVVGSIQFALTDFAGALGTFVVFFLGAYQIIDNKMTIGGLIAFVTIMPNVFSPLSRLVNMNSRIQGALKAIERFDSVWQIKIEEEMFIQSGNKPIQKEVEGNIVFENVYFAYQQHNYVLKNISLSLIHGETLAIVGRSGSGKTTLTNLIPSFYVPQKGSIYIDNINIKDMDIKSLRRQIGYVQQEPFLFAGSVKDNITLGQPNFKENDIITAAREANAYDFIQQLPHKFDTLIGERGINLSVGQKQRLTIARIFLMNPKILILDEPTSALDLESERMLQEAFYRVSKGRTTIIIAHRLSTIIYADKIVVIDDGEIIETGSHNDLIKKDGHYAGIFRIMGRI